MLDEQWRMAPAISDAVSHLFYGSKLKVADLASNCKWIGARPPGPTRLVGDEDVAFTKSRARLSCYLLFRAAVLAICCAAMR